MNKLSPQHVYREHKPTAKISRDNLLFLLSEKWAFGFDELQWIVYHWKGDAKGWRPTFFVRSNKRVLMRNIKERRVAVTPDAKEALGHLPFTFKEWLKQYEAVKVSNGVLRDGSI